MIRSTIPNLGRVSNRYVSKILPTKYSPLISKNLSKTRFYSTKITTNNNDPDFSKN